MTRIMIEYITGKVVADYNPEIPSSAVNFIVGESILGVQPELPPIMRKYHLVDDSLNEVEEIGDSKVNLILRDYYTAINSHSKRGGGTGNLRGDIEKYCNIIKFYDSHENKGVVMYYENLIKLDRQPAELLALFNNNDISDLPNWEGYMDNLEELNGTSKESYTKQYNTVSDNESDKAEYTSIVQEFLSEEQFDRYLATYVI